MRRRWLQQGAAPRMVRTLASAALVAAALTAAACATGDDDDGTDRADRSGTARSDGASSERTGSDRARTTTTTSAPPGTPGAPGVGDPLLPIAGNGGYDVAHYRLEIDASRPDGQIIGETTIDATATQALSSFDLDLAGFTVDAVSVDGARATHVRFGDELVVTPAGDIAADEEFTTVVRYHGTPAPVVEPAAPGAIGWMSGESGTFVAAEPNGAKAIFPANDHPSDKATFEIVVTAPATDLVAANGVTRSRTEAGATATWTFEMDDPMATYLVQIAIGDFRAAVGTAPNGTPLRSVAPIARPTIDLDGIHRRAGEQLAWFAERFGPYPFDVYGILVADIPPTFALETQTLSIFPTSWYLAAIVNPRAIDIEAVEAHELAHQWFGNHVTPTRWSDIWLNEGFATYAEWLWEDHTGTTARSASVADAMRRATRWRRQHGAVADPRPGGLFSDNQYDGAALVLEALRRTVGDDAFFRILRTWVDRHGGGNASTADFEALAAQVTGRDLSGFFAAWLHADTLPAMPPG